MNKILIYPKKGILSKEIVLDGKIDVTLFCMAAGTQISEHTTTKKAIVHVIDGKGIFNLNGKDIEMKPNVAIFMDKNAPHSLRAKDNTSFILVLINN